jgi:predicted Zn finger-like uncharacterized protein
MFTVCPKCALTLVVTPADLRVAQGYVRCGRCSNVFNAIAALSEDRSGNTPVQQPATATTSIIRKAPSIAEDDPPVQDSLSDTGETESIYAEPEPPRSPPPAPTANKKSAPPPPAPMPEFSDSIPDVALEFNPDATDITQVFIEAAPVNIDLRQMTGQFEQIKAPPPEDRPVPPPRQPAVRQQSPPATPSRSAPPPARPTPPPAPSAPPTRAAQRPRDSDDLEIDDELRSLAARMDATGKQPALKPEPPRPAAAKSDSAAAPKSDKVATPRRKADNDVLVYQGSPYNSADEPTNVARKVSASAARRRLAVQPTPAAEREELTGDEEFDAPPADNAGAYETVVALLPRSMPRGRKLAWISGAAALVIVLAAQAVHHNRHDLATNPRLNRPLTRFYQAIGVSLVPRWNLASYEVRQLGAFSGAGDTGNLTVRASLKNNADQPLPLPLLRITVQDRYGNRIATRDVPPKGYAPGALPADARLGVGQRIDAEMSFKDPGRDAVGFEIDACLPTPEGRIACANDTAVAR